MFFRRRRPKHIPAEQVGRDLFEDFVLKAMEDNAAGTKRFAEQYGVDPERWMTEETYLRIFLIDLFTAAALGRGPTKDAVYAAFRAQWSIRLTPDVVETLVTERSPSYAEALRNPHPEYGVSWPIGKVFARSCGAEDDAAVVFYASKLYGSSMRLVEFLRSLAIAV